MRDKIQSIRENTSSAHLPMHTEFQTIMKKIMHLSIPEHAKLYKIQS